MTRKGGGGADWAWPLPRTTAAYAFPASSGWGVVGAAGSGQGHRIHPTRNNHEGSGAVLHGMAKPATAWVAFHADGAWSVTCPTDDDDAPAFGDDGGILGWTSL